MKRNKPMKWLYGFLVCLLVFASVPVSGVSAATLTVTSEVLETEINTSGETIELALDTDWAHDFDTNSERLKALKNSMVADVDQDLWESYKSEITAKIKPGSSNRILEVTLPKDTTYSLSNNQTITINVDGALLENWTEPVDAESFEIIAEPKLLMGGTIDNAAASELRKGGKTIELTLVNAEWNQLVLENSSKLKTFLNNFKAGSSTWSVITKLTSADPSEYLTFSSDSTTLTLTLPPSDATISTEKVEFSFNETDIAAYISNVKGGTLKPSTPLEFNVFGDSDIEITGSLDEESIKGTGTGNALTLTLSNGEWTVFDYQYKKDLLIESLKPVNQTEAWNSIKEELKVNSSFEVDGTDKSKLKLTLKLSNSDNYYLTEDQQLLLKVPSQLLEEEVELPEKTITIEAQPKILVSGTATSAISYEDLVKGGKTIELTLVNTTWEDVSIKANRESLVAMFNWNNLASDSTDIKDQILQKATIIKNNDKKITITLPPLTTFKLNGSPELTINPTGSPTNKDVLNKKETIFQVEPLDKVSAKITAPKGKTEFDVVNDGYTLTISLTNDQWKSNAKSLILADPNYFFTDLVIDPSDVNSVEELSDSELKIKLKASTTYDLSSNKDYELTIKSELLTLSTSDITLTKAFTIDAVTAKLSGTAGSNIDAVTLEKGGKTIIITLNNAKFKENESVTVSDIMTSTPADLKTEFVGSDITIKGNKLTIKLPKITTDESGDLKFIIPADLIDHPGASDIVISDKISIGAKAEATLSPSSLTEATLKGTTFTIDLKAANWDSTIETNKSKQNTLLKGFTVDNQEDEWDNVIDAIKENGKFDIKAGDTTVLNIELPNNINYAIVRDQKVSLKIPKSVLADYKYDIEDVNSITIKSPSFTSTNKTFTAFLPELSKLSGDDIAKTRVYVPEKLLETIQVSNVAIPDSGNITTVVVETSKNAEVTATIITEVKNEDGTVTKTEVPQTKKDSSSTTFIFTNVDPKSELKVTVKDGNTVVEEYKKVGKGKKTYNLLPKKQLDGYYSLERILTDDKLLKDIFKYYKPNELQVGTISN